MALTYKQLTEIANFPGIKEVFEPTGDPAAYCDTDAVSAHASYIVLLISL